MGGTGRGGGGRKKTRTDARTVRRLPYATHRTYAFTIVSSTCDRESRRGIVTGNSHSLPQQSGEFLKSLLPTKFPRNRSRFCNQAHCRRFSLTRRGVRARVCAARVASRARACAETILRREYNCRMVRYGFLSGETRTSTRTRTRTFPSRVTVAPIVHCERTRLFSLSSILRNRSLMPRRDRDARRP